MSTCDVAGATPTQLTKTTVLPYASESRSTDWLTSEESDHLLRMLCPLLGSRGFAIWWDRVDASPDSGERPRLA